MPLIWVNSGSDNGLLPFLQEAIIWANGGLLLIKPLGTILNEICIVIQKYLTRKLFLKYYLQMAAILS